MYSHKNYSNKNMKPPKTLDTHIHCIFDLGDPVRELLRRDAARLCFARNDNPSLPTCLSSAALRWSCIL